MFYYVYCLLLEHIVCMHHVSLCLVINLLLRDAMQSTVLPCQVAVHKICCCSSVCLSVTLMYCVNVSLSYVESNNTHIVRPGSSLAEVFTIISLVATPKFWVEYGWVVEI